MNISCVSKSKNHVTSLTPPPSISWHAIPWKKPARSQYGTLHVSGVCGTVGWRHYGTCVAVVVAVPYVSEHHNIGRWPLLQIHFTQLLDRPLQ